MGVLELDKAEEAIIEAVKSLCSQLGIDEEVNSDLCPGKYLRSDALVSVIPSIELTLGIQIPLECYIFHDNHKNKEKLSIKAAARKLLKIAK
jgi:hypothetical protein